MAKFIIVNQKSGATTRPLAVAVDEILAIGTNASGETVITLPPPVGEVVVRETGDEIGKKRRGRAA